MIEVRQTDAFMKWLKKLRDQKTKARFLVRIRRMELGNFGDHKSVGDGVSELRFAFGPGYRIYFTRQGDKVVVLLVGGDKDTQDKDIAKAKALAEEL